MTKKKVVTFFAVSALCGAMAIGSSMAYLTDHDSVTNKFSVGKVDIALTPLSLRVRLLPLLFRLQSDQSHAA